MLPYPELILFDLDDTLISFNGVTGRAWLKCCTAFAAAHSVPFDAERLLESVNTVREWYWADDERSREGRGDLIAARREVVKLALERLGICEKALSNELADDYSAFQNSLIHLFPNSVRTLERLKAAGLRLGMITNGSKEVQFEKLRRFGLEAYFERVLTEGAYGFGKPDERIFKTALSLFGLPPGACWMVGDNLLADIAASQALGITGVWHDLVRSGLPSGANCVPDAVIHDVWELTRLLGLE